MIKKATASRKISYISSKIRKLKFHQGPTLEEFQNNDDLQDIVLHNLQLAIQACIDLGALIVADEGWGAPGSFSEVFSLLEENKIIPKELCDQLIKMVGFRNRVIHDYEEIDISVVYDIWHEDIKDIEKFLVRVGEFLGV